MSETKENPSRDSTPRRASAAAAAPEVAVSPAPRKPEVQAGGLRSRAVEVLIAKRDGLLRWARYRISVSSEPCGRAA